MTLTQKIKEVFHKHDHSEHHATGEHPTTGEHPVADGHHTTGEHHVAGKHPIAGDHHATGGPHVGATTLAAEGLPIATNDIDDFTSPHTHTHTHTHTHPHKHAENISPAHGQETVNVATHNHAGPSTHTATHAHPTDPLDHHHNKPVNGPGKMRELEAHMREDGFMPPANNGTALR
ncbi:hypothetical protein BD560DRAFT_390758 [Blakeslea trispora]|nr:hypothetical protein BD560DRAFT_390758 [Blakeslea trispora]